MAATYPTPEAIAASIATRYPAVVDPARLQRALALVQSHALDMARKDEHGNPISPSWDVLTLRTSEKYIIRKGACTCPDSSITHHVCKHRLALYILRTLMEAKL